MSEQFISITETDNGSKGRAITAADRFPEELSVEAKWKIRVWWEKVLDTARALCPVDTGTLQTTIRIEDIDMDFGSYFEKTFSPQHELINSQIVAGGLLVNPKTGRVCDYAQAVHDGHFTRSGRWMPPVAFIEMAIQIHSPELDYIMSKALDKVINTVWVGN